LGREREHVLAAGSCSRPRAAARCDGSAWNTPGLSIHSCTTRSILPISSTAPDISEICGELDEKLATSERLISRWQGRRALCRSARRQVALGVFSCERGPNPLSRFSLGLLGLPQGRPRDLAGTGARALLFVAFRSAAHGTRLPVSQQKGLVDYGFSSVGFPRGCARRESLQCSSISRISRRSAS